MVEVQMAVSQKEIDQAKEIGSRGGGVDTNNRTWQDKQALDKAVNDGKRGN